MNGHAAYRNLQHKLHAWIDFKARDLVTNVSWNHICCPKSNYRDVTKTQFINYLGADSVVRAWDQEVCSLCGLRFKSCGCSYDGHWRFTWSLTLGSVRLVKVRANWPGHPR